MRNPQQSLDEAGLALVRETDRDRLAALDEDALVALHRRVRRARNKAVKVHRRRAAAQVVEKGRRGSRNQSDAARVEVFEDALARVSRALARAARRSAAALKAERLAAARKDKPTPTASRARPARRRPAATAKKAPAAKSPARKKREASTLAAGARRQARRDSRGG